VPPKNLKWPAKAEYPLADVFPADHIRQCTETSLANLGLQSVDLQQFHVWSDAWAEDDSWKRAIDDLKREGLIRGFGISINRWQPDSVLKAISSGSSTACRSSTTSSTRVPRTSCFRNAASLGVAVIARVPFDEGSLAGALERGMTWPEGDWRNIYFTPEKLDETLDRIEAVRDDLPPQLSLP
jgi:aryl-alcohol dehydrogenase-like predicted oxidoreductase